MSILSEALEKKFGLPQINLLKNPQTSPFLKPLVDGLTRDNIRKALRELPKDTLTIFGEELVAEAERRGL